MTISISWLNRLFLVVFVVSMVNAFLWVWTGQGAYVLDAASGAVASMFSLLRQLLILAIVALLATNRRVLGNLRDCWPILLLLLYALISAQWSAFKGDSLRNWAWVVMQVLLALYIMRRDWTNALTDLNTIAVGLALLNIAFFAAAPGLARDPGGFGGVYAGAFRGIFPSKNLLGAAAVTCLLINVVFLSHVGWRGHLITKVSLLAWIGMLFLARSSTSVATAMTVVAVFICVRSVLGRMNPFERLWAGAFLTVLITLGTIFSTELLEMFTGALGRDLTFTGRTFIWDFVLRATESRWVFGAGFAGFWQPFVQDKETLTSLGLFYIASSHNGFLEMYASGGIIGLSLTIFVFVYAAIKTALVVFADARGTVAAFCAAMLLACFLQNLTETLFPESYYLNGTMMALVIIAANRRLAELRATAQAADRRPAIPRGRLARS